MEFIIDKAPGKELILKLKETGEFAYLVELFWLRADWCGRQSARPKRLNLRLCISSQLTSLHNLQTA